MVARSVASWVIAVFTAVSAVAAALVVEMFWLLTVE